MLKKKLRNGSIVLGTWCDLPSPAVVNVLAKTKIDFVIIDMEHGPIDHKSAQEMIMAAECEGVEAMVRVSSLNGSEITKVLDAGASGIIVPHIESVDDRKKAVSFSKFYPLGERGFNPYIRSGEYHATDPEYFDRQNKKVVLGLILEGEKALNNLEAIIDDKEVDLIYIGVYDLSVALGLKGDVHSPKVLKELKSALTKIKKGGKAAGCMIHNLSDLKAAKTLGMQFLCYKVDSAIIYDSISEIKGEFDKT